MTSVLDQAKQWIEWDVNDGTKAAVKSLVDANDTEALQKLFASRVEFGTAGLRACMRPGPNGMNDLVVIQTTQGLCKHLFESFGEERARRYGIVIGYDHRAIDSLSSKRFAELAAAVCVHIGMTVYLFEGITATPLVPFCVQRKSAYAGIVITASHNPKQDNGYKIYWANGCQIIPPHDAEIASLIEQNLEPWADFSATSQYTLRANPLVHDPTKDVGDAYFSRLQKNLCRYPEDNAKSPLRIAYTAMHGVGHAFTSRSFAAFSLPPYIPVESQLHPDPAFPTVTFPNPEEGKGALKEAMKTAEERNATLILANDPDADRLAIAEWDEANDQWYIFSGNEIGAMLGHWSLEQWQEGPDRSHIKYVWFVASTVSSKMLKAVAKKVGCNFAETLTGFKWIGNKTEDIRNKWDTVVFSFEEAIGFCVGDTVKDKDGVSAAAFTAEMATQLHSRRYLTLKEYLETLYAKYGEFVTNNHYVICHEPSTIEAIFKRLRNGGDYWTHCGDFEIAHVRDLTTGYDSEQPDKKAILPVSNNSQMITYTFTNGCVATLRTSGTEPKLKYYVELAGKVGQKRQEVENVLATQVSQIVSEMLEPEKNGLEFPED